MAIGRITGQMLSSTLNRDSTNLKFSTAGETNLLFLDATNDRIGIGTGTPAYTLDVTGTARVTSNLRIEGNLETVGTTTTIETANVSVEDPLLELNRAGSGGDIDAGIYLNRGEANNAAVFYWNEGADKFHAVTSNSAASATAVTDSQFETIVAGGYEINSGIGITNSSGDITFDAVTSDKDIIFTVNDGGSADTEVFRIDGSESSILVASGKAIQFADSGESISGDGTDLTIASGGVINLNATTSISANSKKITSVADPVADQDAATKAYVTAQISALFEDKIFEGDSKVEVVDAGDSTNAVVNIVVNNKTVASFAEENDGKLNATLGGIDINDNVISTQSNADIDLQANGTGKVTITSDTGLSIGAGDDFSITLSSDDVTIDNATSDKDIIFTVNDGGSADTEVMRVDGSAASLLIASGKKIEFADSGESISSDGTDLTVASGGDISLTATSDVNIPSNVGLTFGADTFKIESDGTNLNINTAGAVAVSGNMTVSGDLQISGTTTYIDTTNLLVEDPLILLSKNNSGGADVDAGIIIERGSAGNNAAFYWNEGDDTFKAVTTVSGHDATSVTDTALAGIVAGKLTADNLELDGNTITATSGDIILGADVDLSGQRIKTTESNADILLDPSGTGTVNVVGAKVTNLGAPSANSDAATKEYVDDTVAALSAVRISDADSLLEIADGTGLFLALDSTRILEMRSDIAIDMGSSSTGMVLPKGNTAARPTAETGLMRFNSQTGQIEVCVDGSTFNNLATVSDSAPIIKNTATGDGSTTSFASFFTSAPADENNVIVVVDNVIQQPDVNYTISGTTLTFDQAPHNGASIYAIVGLDNGSTVAPAFTSLSTDIIPAANNTYDIGSSSKKWKEGFFVTVTATYGDVAERYAADSEITAGTVVQLGGSQEVTVTTEDATDEVFGVVSSRPGFGLNKEMGPDQTHPWIAQVGRVDVKVKGTVNKGDRLIASSTPGVARAATKAECTAFNVIGRALETKTTSSIGLVLTSVKVSH